MDFESSIYNKLTLPTSVNFIPGFTTLATAAAVGDMAVSSSSDSMAPG